MPKGGRAGRETCKRTAPAGRYANLLTCQGAAARSRQARARFAPATQTPKTSVVPHVGAAPKRRHRFMPLPPLSGGRARAIARSHRCRARTAAEATCSKASVRDTLLWLPPRIHAGGRGGEARSWGRRSPGKRMPMNSRLRREATASSQSATRLHAPAPPSGKPPLGRPAPSEVQWRRCPLP